MNDDAEYMDIRVKVPTSKICPICEKAVDPNSQDAGYTVSGHGRFRKKRYFHNSCYDFIKNNP